MDLTKTVTVDAPAELVWPLVSDPGQWGSWVPESSGSADPAGSFTVHTGLMSLWGTAEVVERDADGRRLVVRGEAQDRLGRNCLDAFVTVQLSPDGEQTAVAVTARLRMTGPIAQYGPGPFDRAADRAMAGIAAALATAAPVVPPARRASRWWWAGAVVAVAVAVWARSRKTF
ncbi:SRPBCC family protein [Amycolatopsis jejuensis]|uniref:SRPBCC family protein n=1 Tax=Amycolatopsis jejuensis TaxID=330084 RepID=UPI0005263F81|nr:SRPBCC family protein [Amycolatopsis jejuensis]